MRADLGALLDDADAEFAARRGGELLQPDRRGEAGRPGADDDDIVFHPLALDFRHRVTPCRLTPVFRQRHSRESGNPGREDCR